jgi:hypothetical protein
MENIGFIGGGSSPGAGDVIIITGLILWFIFIGVQAIGGFGILQTAYDDTIEYLQRVPLYLLLTALIPVLIVIVLLLGN